MSNVSGTKQRQIKAAVAEVVGAKLATLDGEAGDRLLGKLDLLRECIKSPITNIIDELSRDIPPKLKLVNAGIELGAVESHDPQAFYQTRKGLYVWPEFKSRVLSSAKPVSNLSALSLNSYELTENMYDKDIKAELPAGHVFEDPSELCARIEQMISKQPNGEEGDLLNNGYANLFDLPGYVVDVHWDGDYREWYVYAWELDDDRWHAGCRVFSRN